MHLRWLGAAGFELRSEGGTVLLIDPYLSRPAAARPSSPLIACDILHADAILVTHGHFDHAQDVPDLANRLDAPVYASASVCRCLAYNGARPSLLNPLAPAAPVQVGDVQVHALAARHVRFDLALVLKRLPHLPGCLGALRPLLLHWPAGQVLAFHIVSSTLSLVHLGSAGWPRDISPGLRPDLALIPVQGRSDIVQVAVRLARLFQPGLVVPHHWDDFYPPLSQLVPLLPFVEALSRAMPATQLHVPQPGRWWQAPHW